MKPIDLVLTHNLSTLLFAHFAVLVDNKTKMLVERPEREVLQLALSQHPAKAPQEVKLVSEQMSLAALTFLSTTVPALDEAIVSRTGDKIG